MRKTLSLIATFMFVLFLAACNQTAEPVDKQGKEGDKKEETKELTLEEVMEKSIEASESLKSFAVQMDMDSNMKVADESMSFKSNIDMDYIVEPLAVHQNMKLTSIEEEGELEMEIYFTKDGVFVHDPVEQQWSKFPNEMFDQISQLTDQQTNPAEEITNLKEFADDLEFKQDDKNYIILLDASGDKFTEFLQEVLKETMPKDVPLDEQLLKDMKINKLNYEIFVDKKTFYPSALNVDMEMEMAVEGQTLVIEQKLEGNYSKFNEIKEIKVPQEVLDNAVEAEM
ncbi:hypothetical protein K6959_13360 [Bacillus aquiflavi]|uniref:DUF6612 family protein n=1 Tax=Bacillus aquiflavi TaxID=2672567 RepID=UPI001CA8C541|nr:DUF6612 family protein [Bacillus aquiflavi]UAC47637.1 hypothetical protein K6959_13360 [Bacillus aquiflavi]